MRAKVADFGLSTKQRVRVKDGSPFWMAPELLEGRGGFTMQSDVFAYGVAPMSLILLFCSIKMLPMHIPTSHAHSDFSVFNVDTNQMLQI
jgi:serine/threonine protein kinase